MCGGFSGVHVVIKNLDIRTYDNLGISGVDLQHALRCKLENVFINTVLYNVTDEKNAGQTRVSDVHDPENLGVAD